MLTTEFYWRKCFNRTIQKYFCSNLAQAEFNWENDERIILEPFYPGCFIWEQLLMYCPSVWEKYEDVLFKFQRPCKFLHFPFIYIYEDIEYEIYFNKKNVGVEVGNIFIDCWMNAYLKNKMYVCKCPYLYESILVNRSNHVFIFCFFFLLLNNERFWRIWFLLIYLKCFIFMSSWLKYHWFIHTYNCA